MGGAAAHQLRPLKSLQKRDGKYMAKKKSSNDALKTTCILTLQHFIDFQISLLIMNSINDKVPQYIKALFTLYPNGYSRFRLPLPRLDIFKSHNISFSVVMSWNSLFADLRGLIRSILLNNFKRELRYYLLSNV